MPNTAILEGLIISTTYAGLITAKLNTRTRSVYISSTIGRDLNPATALDDILARLDSWSQTCQNVLTEINGDVQRIRSEAEQRRRDAIMHNEAKIRAQNTTKSGSGKQRAGPQEDETMSEVMHGDETAARLLDRPVSKGTVDSPKRKRETPENGRS